MNRLWVRLGLMIASVLFLVFFMQFLSIMLEPEPGPFGPPLGHVGPPDETRVEMTWRLVRFMTLSLVVGLGSGLFISRIVTAPIDDLVQAARRIGAGDLNVRVKKRGAQEMIELAETFNHMASELQSAETLRNNLMADVSHELRTPLTVLESNLRALLDHVYTLDEAEIANLYGQTRHLIRLVNDLRELTIAENHQLHLEKQSTELNELINETIQAIQPVVDEKNVRLTTDLQPLPSIQIDATRIRQVLFNLLSNALRHTPSGGFITVTDELRGNGIVLSIQDNGDGLDTEQLHSVFDRFYRGDKSRSRETGGSGLGLAIVKAIVETHGGQVEVHSEGKGKGATFSIILPLQVPMSTITKKSQQR